MCEWTLSSYVRSSSKTNLTVTMPSFPQYRQRGLLTPKRNKQNIVTASEQADLKLRSHVPAPARNEKKIIQMIGQLPR